MKRADYLSQSPFSLSLSSGFFGFFAHLGFYTAFEARGLLPVALSGSSAGALVAAGVASGLNAVEMKDLFLSISKNDFWDPAFGYGYLQGQKFEDLLKKYFAQDFKNVHVPLYISVFNINKKRTEVLTEGSIASAVRASSAVPLFFHPVKIGNHHYWDGGIRDRAGVRGVDGIEATKVLHYLPAKGLVSHLEDKYWYRDLHDIEHFFKMEGPVKMGPHRMHHGAEVIDYYYQATLQWLDQDFMPSKK